MLSYVNLPVSVVLTFDAIKKTTFPHKIKWNNQIYKIKSLAYYHQIKEGVKIQHIFHVSDGNLDFRLRLDSYSLNWILEEVSDGLAN